MFIWSSRLSSLQRFDSQEIVSSGDRYGLLPGRSSPADLLASTSPWEPHADALAVLTVGVCIVPHCRPHLSPHLSGKWSVSSSVRSSVFALRHLLHRLLSHSYFSATKAAQVVNNLEAKWVLEQSFLSRLSSAFTRWCQVGLTVILRD